MFGWIKRTAMWAAGLATLLLAAWMAGRRDQRQQSSVTYAKTRKEIDDVESNIGDDPAVLRAWLKERGRQ